MAKILNYWKQLAAIAIPIIFLPIPLIYQNKVLNLINKIQLFRSFIPSNFVSTFLLDRKLNVHTQS